MRSAKPILTLALAATGLLAVAGGAHRQSDERACALLLKTLVRTYPQNVIALILQRSPENGGVMMRIQVQINREGKMRQTVLSPLSMEGVETIDDNSRSATYQPDRNLLVIQESRKGITDDAQSRLTHARKNYDIKLGGRSEIAGRAATLVTATPHSNEMESRRFYIDDKTGFLLQLETVDPIGRLTVGFRTQAVNYPASLPSAVFDIGSLPKNAQVMSFQRPQTILAGGKDVIALGFQPITPERLPYGFYIQDIQISKNPQSRSVAVRITDGLVKATVYQWDDSSKIDIDTPGASVNYDGEIKLAVVADVPERVRQKILRAFMDSAIRGNVELPIFSGLAKGLELSLRQISLSLKELPPISIVLTELGS